MSNYHCGFVLFFYYICQYSLMNFKALVCYTNSKLVYTKSYLLYLKFTLSMLIYLLDGCKHAVCDISLPILFN